jgi:hypothetical protein
MTATEIKIPVPWGHIAGNLTASPKDLARFRFDDMYCINKILNTVVYSNKRPGPRALVLVYIVAKPTAIILI